jgi:hypothetical protein
VVDRLRFELQDSANSRQTHGDEFPDTTGGGPSLLWTKGRPYRDHHAVRTQLCFKQ